MDTLDEPNTCTFLCAMRADPGDYDAGRTAKPDLRCARPADDGVCAYIVTGFAFNTLVWQRVGFVRASSLYAYQEGFAFSPHPSDKGRGLSTRLAAIVPLPCSSGNGWGRSSQAVAFALSTHPSGNGRGRSSQTVEPASSSHRSGKERDLFTPQARTASNRKSQRARDRRRWSPWGISEPVTQDLAEVCADACSLSH